MGPAHSSVKNLTERRICVLTFTYTDLIYLQYNTLYVIEPGSTVLVESQPDATGLKIGLVYDVDLAKKEFHYQRFVCKTDSVLSISEIDYDEISWFGDNITGPTKSKIRETNITAFTMAKEAVENVPPTIGKRNGKFEKELIKRVTSDYMEKRQAQKESDEQLNGSNNGSVSGKNPVAQSNTFYNPPKEQQSAAEKWELQLEKIRQEAAEKEAKLAESKALIAERLARVAEEQAQAEQQEAERAEKARLEVIRQREIDKIRREQDHDEAVGKKNGKKGKKGKGKNKGGSSCSLM